ncbi:hypothetical protein ASPZODRAFT_23853 [Penicilliopsis zonata CBS 506.65]|uniref:NAD-dependent epimerase/dehydratase domain-containing protein n=1 Tax=Penicilliopsis zonata CBS 506.65 TaxID=1073090 RepID=A0A1L9SM61_9EURO|nr:hypothetical protein ASPZODRAFT_23853 [Penicilliopsis zonata CBS 506.65]OJJ48196.1 hypothetical protein ASPZODRAFT_23853 [Penicilliopsis zonata CBS 506.65]
MESDSSPDTPATQWTLSDNELSLMAKEIHQDILVTGGLGFIGSHTTLELLKAGYNVIVIDNLSNAYEDVLARIEALASRYHEEKGTQMPALRLHAHDYRDTARLRPLLDEYVLASRWGKSPQSTIAGVIHFAALKCVEESIRHPLRYYANNVGGLIEFLSLLSEYGIKRFIFSSSATVYGAAAGDLPLTEERCAHQVDGEEKEGGEQKGCAGITNPYGRTKWMCEALLADLAVSDPEWTIVALRYFNPIGCDSSGLLGEDPRQPPCNLFPVIVKVITGQAQEVQVFGTDWDTADGTAVRDFIHVSDLARGHIAALNAATAGSSTTLKGPFRAFNLGTGRGHSVLQVLSAMEAVACRPIPRRAAARRAGDVGSCVAVATRANEELQWESQKSLRDACVDSNPNPNPKP